MSLVFTGIKFYPTLMKIKCKKLRATSDLTVIPIASLVNGHRLSLSYTSHKLFYHDFMIKQVKPATGSLREQLL